MEQSSSGTSRPTPGSSDRTFGFVMAGALGTAFLLPLLKAGRFHWWILVVAICFAVAAVLVPSGLAPLNRLWTRFGLILHRIVSPIILGVMYFGILTPLAVVMRLRGRDELRLRFDPAAGSYWFHRHPPGPTPESLKRQF